MKLRIAPAIFAIISNGFHLSASSLSTPQNKMTTAPSNCPCGVKGSNSGGGRIVGGEDAEAHEYPWQVGVEINGRFPWCGGTLISAREVLTAAHCTYDRMKSRIKVIVGENDITDAEQIKLNVAEVLIHPMYNKTNYNNDFSILRLASPVSFSSKISPVCLPSNVSDNFTGEVATVTGWGSLGGTGNQIPEILQEVNVTIITNDVCKSAPSRFYKKSISEAMLCASAPGKDSCQGDSGGPLTVVENGRGTLVGVVSWGQGCALPKFPGVYARVTAAMDWILENSHGTYYSSCVSDTLSVGTEKPLYTSSTSESQNFSVNDSSSHSSRLISTQVILLLLSIISFL